MGYIDFIPATAPPPWVPNGLASLTAGTSRQTVRIQTGSLAVYAIVMLIGVVALVAFYLLVR